MAVLIPIKAANIVWTGLFPRKIYMIRLDKSQEPSNHIPLAFAKNLSLKIILTFLGYIYYKNIHTFTGYFIGSFPMPILGS